MPEDNFAQTEAAAAFRKLIVPAMLVKEAAGIRLHRKLEKISFRRGRMLVRQRRYCQTIRNC